MKPRPSDIQFRGASAQSPNEHQFRPQQPSPEQLSKLIAFCGMQFGLNYPSALEAKMPVATRVDAGGRIGKDRGAASTVCNLCSTLSRSLLVGLGFRG